MATHAAVENGSLFAAGLHSDFEATYHQEFDNVLKGLGDIMDLSRSTTLRTTTYGYRDTAPYPRRRDQGDPPFIEGMESTAYSATVYDFNTTVSWHRNDRMDNQVGDIVRDAQMAGAHFATIPNDFSFELMTASADLLPAIPTAPDGAAMYATTNGAGAARFGVTDGNLYTGTGTTGAQIRADTFGAIERMSTFQNTKGKPYFRPSIQAVRYVIVFGAALQGEFIEAFQADIVQGSSAGISNTLKAGNLIFDFRPTADIMDSDYFIFRTDVPVKPMFLLTREDVRSTMSTEDNSDEARRTGNEAIQFDARLTAGLNLPISTIKVNN